MSINVNVSGNPVRINRGTLVAADPDYAKKEFDKRRRMRLEQVRHQSKEIAENVRNKVRKGKQKQLSDFEKQEEEKLKQWQNRKLLELQQQYCESLKNIGLGHVQAVIENERDEIETAFKDKLKEKAEERGEKAEQKLQAEKNKDNIKKAIPLQHKKLSRDIENARSAMVAKNKIPSKKRKKKNETNINITTNVSDDSNSVFEEEYIEELNLPNDSYDSSLSDAHQSGARRRRTNSPSTFEESSVNSPEQKLSKNKCKSSGKTKLNPSRTGSPTKNKPLEAPITHYPMDTRISDRIKNRRFFINPTQTCESYHTELEENRLTLQSEPSTSINTGRHVHKTTSTVYNQQNKACSCKCTCSKHITTEQGKTEIPVKPTVGLRTLTKIKASEKDKNKVQYYDHDNRFSKEYLNVKSNVQKIPEENIETYPSTNSEKEYRERISNYDKDAEIRGQIAMRKVNIHKEYDEMMKQLPVLQKQERIAAIGGDKPIFHMSEDRIKEYQRQKQNYLDNIYERNFPKTITIATKKNVIEEEPFKTVDISQSNPVLNVAQWDVNKQIDNGFTLRKDSGHIVIETDATPDNKEDYLKYLLERLKHQKEMLLREADSLPRNSNLTNIIEDLEKFRDNEDGSKQKSREINEKILSKNECPCSNQDKDAKIDDPKLLEKKSSTQKRIHQSVLSTSSSSTNSTPSKKKKFKSYKIILQNTSTQTSPKIIMDANEDKENTRGLAYKEEIGPALATTKAKRLTKKQSPRKGSSSTKTVKSTKNTVSRTTSPFASAITKDQASSPIITNITARDSAKSTSVTSEPPIKCKCYAKNAVKTCKCKCHSHVTGDQSEVCEILIKIKDNQDPEIQVKSPTKHRKGVLVNDTTQKGVEERTVVDAIKQKDKDSSKRTVKINDKFTEKSKTSWREQFSKNETAGGTSTSTSYFSPPDFTKPSDYFKRPQAQSTCTRSTDISKKSSQSKKKIDPRLLVYIKKLLSMSRTSIEELGVSTVSDVSTPSSSLFDNTNQSENTSLNQLRNVIKYFNLNPEDLAHYLNYSEDTERTSGSLFNPNFSSPSTVHSSGYDAGKSQGNNATNSSDQSKVRENDMTSAHSKLSSEGGGGKPRSRPASPHDHTAYPTPIKQYGELADLCQKRISQLAGMIEKVRLEKQQILSPIHSDKENSTQYLVLPPHLYATSPNVMHDNTSANSDLEQAEINRKMLEIDYSLAERLKLMTPEQVMEYNRTTEVNKSSALDDISKELLERYTKLISVSEKVSENDDKSQRENLAKPVQMHGDKFEVQEDTVSEEIIASHSPNTAPYVPLLLDIPRLPKLVPHNGENTESPCPDSLTGKSKKPPPAKGLRTAKRFNENITNVPHELSTIVEVDSQLSTKVRPSVSPQPLTNRTPQLNAFDNVNPVIVLPEFPTDWLGKRHKEKENKTPEGSVPDIIAEITHHTEEVEKKDVAKDDHSKNITSKVGLVVATKENKKIEKCNYTNTRVLQAQSTDSSTEKSDSDNIEAMLKSMGMGWAISTLKKTQEALNRASSTSSSDDPSKLLLSNKSDSSLGGKSQPSNQSSTSDITLRDLLGKKLFSNTSSSSLSHILSPSLARTIEELSTIHGSGKSSDNKQQRTSTPVHTTKSSDSHKKGIFTAESEVSSVKLSDENFVTMRNTTGNNSD